MKEALHDSDIMGVQMGQAVNRLLWPIPVTDSEYYTPLLIKIRILHDAGFAGMAGIAAYAQTESWPATIASGIAVTSISELLIQPLLWKLTKALPHKTR